MSDDLRAEQTREWGLLYDRIAEVLQQYGQADDADGQKDYLLVDENVRFHQHRIETENLAFAQPVVIAALQKLLIGYPNWEIMIALGRFGGVVIHDDEIIDGLQREHLPQEFQTIEYEGSRPLRTLFGNITY
jgi:hypothetical protein